MYGMILSGKIVWPKLFKPEAFDEKTEPKFSCGILIPKDDPQVEEMMANVKQLIKDELRGKQPDERYFPIKDGDEASNEDYAGCWEVRCKAKEDKRPGVVDQNLDPIIDPSAVEGGDEVNVDVLFFAYNSRFTGIGCSLGNVQLVSKGDKPIGGGRRKAADVFTKIGPSTAAGVSQQSAPKGFLD